MLNHVNRTYSIMFQSISIYFKIINTNKVSSILAVEKISVITSKFRYKNGVPRLTVKLKDTIFDNPQNLDIICIRR